MSNLFFHPFCKDPRINDSDIHWVTPSNISDLFKKTLSEGETYCSPFLGEEICEFLLKNISNKDWPMTSSLSGKKGVRKDLFQSLNSWRLGWGSKTYKESGGNQFEEFHLQQWEEWLHLVEAYQSILKEGKILDDALLIERTLNDSTFLISANKIGFKGFNSFSSLHQDLIFSSKSKELFVEIPLGKNGTRFLERVKEREFSKEIISFSIDSDEIQKNLSCLPFNVYDNQSLEVEGESTDHSGEFLIGGGFQSEILFHSDVESFGLSIGRHLALAFSVFESDFNYEAINEFFFQWGFDPKNEGFLKDLFRTGFSSGKNEFFHLINSKEEYQSNPAIKFLCEVSKRFEVRITTAQFCKSLIELIENSGDVFQESELILSKKKEINHEFSTILSLYGKREKTSPSSLLTRLMDFLNFEETENSSNNFLKLTNIENLKLIDEPLHCLGFDDDFFKHTNHQSSVFFPKIWHRKFFNEVHFYYEELDKSSIEEVFYQLVSCGKIKSLSYSKISIEGKTCQPQLRWILDEIKQESENEIPAELGFSEFSPNSKLVEEKISNTHVFSIGQFEQYIKCPQKYYNTRILDFNEPAKRSLTVNPLDRGRFCHDVMEKAFIQITENHSHLDQIEKLINGLVNDYQKNHFIRGLISGKNYRESFFEKHKKLLSNVLKNEISNFPQILSENSKILTEFPFWVGIVKNQDSSFNIHSINFDEDSWKDKIKRTEILNSFLNDRDPSQTLFLHGICDRIDLIEAEGELHYSVVDYKYSKGSIPSLNKIKRYESIQLPVYMAVLEKVIESRFSNGKSVKPKFGSYVGIQDGSRINTIDLTKMGEDKYHSLLNEVINKCFDLKSEILNCQFPAKPLKSQDCLECHCYSVCSGPQNESWVNG